MQYDMGYLQADLKVMAGCVTYG
uniref:Uncharacterized protein n=1 Tax=Arundo donax TaxID=35708 RepID=A0A0A9BES6_ARUDO